MSVSEDTNMESLKRDAVRLAEALRYVSQALAWREFGECRGYAEKMLSPSDSLHYSSVALIEHAAAMEQHQLRQIKASEESHEQR